MINFWSYKKEYKKNKKKYLKNIDMVLQKGNIFFGNELIKFEKNFLTKNKAKFGVAVGSGTDALLIALMSLSLKQNDEVIVPANTAIPTVSAIINAGYKPRLVDVGDDYLIDTNKIELAINNKTKVIIPVHLYGQACNMSKILQIAKKYKLKVVEDCAQSQGAKFKNKYLGTFGDLGCYSFYPTKILGAYGDGGFIISKNKNLYEKIKRIRFYGIETNDKSKKFYNEYYSYENGLNSRIDEMQCSILNIKLKKVENFIKKRRYLAKLYINNLKNTGIILPLENKYCYHVYNSFTVYHKKKSSLISYLIRRGIKTRVIYPYPIHKMEAYRHLAKSTDLRVSNKFSTGIFCLPLYPELNSKIVLKICNEIKNFLKK